MAAAEALDRGRAVKSKKSATYEVTLRRDVQQVARVRVEASTRQEAIAVAESVVDETAWEVEGLIGAHKTSAREARR